MNSRVDLTWRLAAQIADEVTLWVRDSGCPSFKGKFTPENQLRLLRLRTWHFRYKLPVRVILSFIVPALRKHIRFYSKRNSNKVFGLGVTVPVLVGRGAENILREKIRKKFPN